MVSWRNISGVVGSVQQGLTHISQRLDVGDEAGGDQKRKKGDLAYFYNRHSSALPPFVTGMIAKVVSPPNSGRGILVRDNYDGCGTFVVVSDNLALIKGGALPAPEEVPNGHWVAKTGEVDIVVRGTVNIGDWIGPLGDGSGIGIVKSPKYGPSDVVGNAVSTKAGDTDELVTVSIPFHPSAADILTLMTNCLVNLLYERKGIKHPLCFPAEPTPNQNIELSLHHTVQQDVEKIFERLSTEETIDITAFNSMHLPVIQAVEEAVCTENSIERHKTSLFYQEITVQYIRDHALSLLECQHRRSSLGSKEKRDHLSHQAAKLGENMGRCKSVVQDLKTLVDKNMLGSRYEIEKIREQEFRARIVLRKSGGDGDGENSLPWSDTCLGKQKAKHAAADIALSHLLSLEQLYFSAHLLPVSTAATEISKSGASALQNLKTVVDRLTWTFRCEEEIFFEQVFRARIVLIKPEQPKFLPLPWSETFMGKQSAKHAAADIALSYLHSSVLRKDFMDTTCKKWVSKLYEYLQVEYGAESCLLGSEKVYFEEQQLGLQFQFRCVLNLSKTGGCQAQPWSTLCDSKKAAKENAAEIAFAILQTCQGMPGISDRLVGEEMDALPSKTLPELSVENSEEEKPGMKLLEEAMNCKYRAAGRQMWRCEDDDVEQISEQQYRARVALNLDGEEKILSWSDACKGKQNARHAAADIALLYLNSSELSMQDSTPNYLSPATASGGGVLENVIESIHLESKPLHQLSSLSSIACATLSHSQFLAQPEPLINEKTPMMHSQEIIDTTCKKWVSKLNEYLQTEYRAEDCLLGPERVYFEEKQLGLQFQVRYVLNLSKTGECQAQPWSTLCDSKKEAKENAAEIALAALVDLKNEISAHALPVSSAAMEMSNGISGANVLQELKTILDRRMWTFRCEEKQVREQVLQARILFKSKQGEMVLHWSEALLGKQNAKHAAAKIALTYIQGLSS